jgi:hypothetical protein
MGVAFLLDRAVGAEAFELDVVGEEVIDMVVDQPL